MTLEDLEVARARGADHFHCENDCDKAAFVVCVDDNQLHCVYCKSGLMVECTPETCGANG